jgi:Tfp pilus assembly protein PilV
MSRARRRRGRRPGLGDDRGVTIIEVTIAAMLLAISSLAVLGLVDAANRNNFRSEQSQVVNDVLQREMEAIKQRPYFEVALSGLPTQSGDPQSPNARVEGTTFNINQTGASSYQGLVYNDGRAPSVAQGSDGSLVAGGTVDPGPTHGTATS